MTNIRRRMLLGLAIVAWAAACIQAQALPAAEVILDRFVEATGGKAAYQQHRTEILTGTISFPAQGLNGSLTRYAAAPDKEYSVVELGPIGKIESGVSAGIAWEKSTLLGARLKSGEEKSQAARQARFNAPLDWRAIYVKVETAGTETVRDEECYKVVLTPTAGKTESQFFSKKTGLLVKTIATAASPMGEIPVEVELSGYQQFGGVLYPTRSRQKAGGQDMEITITGVRLNEAIPDEYFQLPPEIRALLDKAAGK